MKGTSPKTEYSDEGKRMKEDFKRQLEEWLVVNQGHEHSTFVNNVLVNLRTCSQLRDFVANPNNWGTTIGSPNKTNTLLVQIENAKKILRSKGVLIDNGAVPATVASSVSPKLGKKKAKAQPQSQSHPFFALLVHSSPNADLEPFNTFIRQMNQIENGNNMQTEVIKRRFSYDQLWNETNSATTKGRQLDVATVRELPKVAEETGVPATNWVPIGDAFARISNFVRNNSQKSGVLYFHFHECALLLFCNCVVRQDDCEEQLDVVWENVKEITRLTRKDLKIDDDSLSGEKYSNTCARFPLPKPGELPPDKVIDPAGIFPSQEAIGKELFKTMFPENSLKEYTHFDFRVIVPPRISLAKQTEERIVLLLWDHTIPSSPEKDTLRKFIRETLWKKVSIFDKEERDHPKDQAWDLLYPIQQYVASRVLKANLFVRKRSALVEQLADDVEEIPEGGKKLMLIIHDECHWGAISGGQVDILLNGAPHANDDGESRNHRNPLTRENVVILHISATAWNYSNISTVEPKVVTWAQSPDHYISYESYKDPSKRICCEGIEESSKDFLTGKTKRIAHSVALMIDYALAFITTLQPTLKIEKEPTKSSIDIVNHISTSNASTDIVLIRAQRYGLQIAFTTLLKQLRAMFPDNHPIRKWKIVCPSEPSISELPLTSFVDLKGYRSIVIVVEKGRMGDSFPSVSHFDLRARYHKLKTSAFSSFVQDLGRVFGYDSTNAVVHLSPVGEQLYNGEALLLDRFLEKLKSEKLPEEFILMNPEFAEAILFDPSASKTFKNMWTSLSDGARHHVCNNRYILQARPQVGKTGAFLQVLRMLLLDARLILSNIKETVRPNTLSEWHKILKHKSGEELVDHWKSNRSDFCDYHALNDKINLPSTLLEVQSVMTSLKLNELHVLDFGCGRSLLLLDGLLHLEKDKKIKLGSYTGIDAGAEFIKIANQEPHVVVKLYPQSLNTNESLWPANVNVIFAIRTLSWTDGEDTLNLLQAAWQKLPVGGVLIYSEMNPISDPVTHSFPGALVKKAYEVEAKFRAGIELSASIISKPLKIDNKTFYLRICTKE